MTPALAAGPAVDEDALAFVAPGMSSQDVASLVCGNAGERSAYLGHVRQRYPLLPPREQLRAVLLKGEELKPSPEAAGLSAATYAGPLIPIVGRALIQAAKRYGPAVFNSLRSAVRRGYGAFNDWVRRHAFAAGVMAGVAGNAVYDWLRAHL